MCELFAMSARHPAAVTFSLEEFSRHGGLSGPHKDGWGIAYLVDRDARIIKEPVPAATSAYVQFIENHPTLSRTVISHIRKATRGRVALENTQPFSRELGGRLHVFAHNGDLDVDPRRFRPCRHRPLGDTDSERAFCALLCLLEPLWLDSEEVPSIDARRDALVSFARDLRQCGIGNFLYTDGEILAAHGHKRHQADGEVRPPGLHYLCRHCEHEPSASFSAEGFTLVSGEPGEQDVVLFASVPLTREDGWRELRAGEVMIAADGEILSHTIDAECSTA